MNKTLNINLTNNLHTGGARITNKVDQLFGWAKLPRNMNVIGHNNNFVKSFRKLYRKRTDLRNINGDKLLMIPAIRDQKIARYKNYGIVPSYNENNIMNNKFDLSDLDPILISKLYYNVIVLKAELWKEEFKTIPWLKSKMCHKWSCEDEEVDFYDSDSIIEAPVVTVVGRGKGNCTEEVMELLKSEIDKFKGFKEYMRVYLESESNEYAYISRSDNKLTINGGLFNPLKVCNMCHNVCHYASMDRVMRSVHYSLKHYKPKSKVINEKFETIRNTEDTICHVPWRCGFCFTDLNLEIKLTKEEKLNIISIVLDCVFVLFGDLEQLMKLGYSDTYDDLNHEQKQTIKTHDQIITNEYFFHMQRKIVPVGQDLDKVSQTTISSHMGGCYFRHVSKYNSIKPELTAELSTCREYLRQLFSGGEVACIGDILPNINHKYHQWFRGENMFPNETGMGCSSTGVCEHKEQFKVFGNIDALKLPISVIVELVKKQRSLQLIMPMKSNNNSLMDKTGLFMSEGPKLNLFIDGNPVPIELKADTFNILHNYDLLIYESQYYLMTTTKKLSLCKIVNITGPYSQIHQLPKLTIGESMNKVIRLNLPDVNSFMGSWVGMNFKMHEFELNPGLFKYLCLRNISSKVGHNTLRQYAIGYTLRRFVVHNKVISNPGILYEQIDIHIILSRMCMMRMKQTYELSYGYSSFLKLLGPFRGLISDAEMAITTCLISLISELILDKLGLDLSTVIKMLNSSSLQTIITGLSDNNIWDALLTMSENIKFNDLKTINVDSETLTESVDNVCSCYHHKSHCNHAEKHGLNRCICCHFRITDERFCSCCKPKHTDMKYYKEGFEKTVDKKPLEKYNVKATVKPGLIMRAQKEVEKFEAKLGRLTMNLPDRLDEKQIIKPHLPKTDSTIDNTSADTSAPERKEMGDDRLKWMEILSKPFATGIKKTKELLAEITDKAVTAVTDLPETEIISKLGYNFMEHVVNCVEYENVINAEPSTIYNMPHCVSKITILPSDTFKLVKTINLPNKDINSCGLEAFNYSSDIQYTLNEFNKLSGSQPPYSQFNLISIAEEIGENVIILCENEVLIGKYNISSDEFIVIHLKEGATPNDIGHFSPAIIERKSRGNQYFVHSQPNNINDRNAILQARKKSNINVHSPGDLSVKDNLICELTFFLSMSELPTSNLISNIVMLNINGKPVMTNNYQTEINNPDVDKYHVPIAEHFIDQKELIGAALSEKLTLNDLPEVHHVQKEIPNDIVEVYKGELLDVLRHMCKVQQLDKKLDSSMIKQSIKGILMPWFKYSKFSSQQSTKHKLKKLDIVFVRSETETIKCQVIGFDKTHVILDVPLITERKVMLTELKSSYGSLIRKLIGLNQPILTKEQIMTLFSSATYTTGPAGFGKSTKIAEQVSHGDLCLAMTSSSVRSLKEKIGQKCKVMSLERAIFTHEKCDQTLFIDECTMLPWSSIGLLAKPGVSLRLFGADNQIGYIDMSSTAGVRHITTIKELIPQRNIVTANWSYRIGTPMIDLIRDVEPGIITKAKHKTTYNIQSLDDGDFCEIDRLVNQIRPDVIITPYSYNKQRITEYLKTRVCEVVTTHSFQGVEVDRALVVLRSDVTGKWDLNSDPKYLNSALTRAKFHTEIVLYGYPKIDITRLTDFMGVSAGVRFIGKNLLEEVTEITDEQEMQVGINLPNQITMETMHNLTEEEINALNSLDLTMEGANIKYKKLTDGTEVRVTRFGLNVAIITNINGHLEFDCPKLIKDKLEENRCTPLQLPEGDRQLLTGRYIKHKVDLNIRTTNKIRELLWIVDKTHDGKFNIKVNNVEIMVTKTASCPLFAGVEFSTNEEILIISNGWQGITKRNIYTHKTKTYDGLSSIIKWLDLQVPGIIINNRTPIGWLKLLTGDMANLMWQLQERATMIHIWFLNLLTLDSNAKCWVNNTRNISLFNRFSKFADGELLDRHQSVINHKTLIIKKKKKLTRLRTYYALCSREGIQYELCKDSNELQWSSFVVECLQDIRQDGKMYGVSITDIEIPGLLLPLTKHFELGTSVKAEVCKQVNEINKLTMDGVHDLIRLDKHTHAMCQQELNNKFPKLIVTPGNYDLTNSPVEHCLEQVIVNMLGKLNKDSEELVVYGGPIPLTVCIQGKYYIKIRVPGIKDELRYNYDLQLPTINSMLSMFNLKRETNAQIDIMWDHVTPVNRMILGTDIACYSELELYTMLCKSNVLYGWVPILKHKNDWFIYDSKNNYIGYKQGLHGKQIRNNLLLFSGTGKPMLANKDANRYIEVTTVLEFLDHRLIKLEYKSIPVCGYVDRCIGTRQDINGIINITVPWINFDLGTVLTNSKVITTRQLQVNKLLLRNILLRLLTGDDDIESLLAYTRTLESTQLITEKGIQSLSTSNLSITLNTAWYAHYIHNDYIGKFKILISTINSVGENKVALEILSKLLPSISKLFGVVSINIEKFSKQIIDNLNQNVNLVNSLMDIVKENNNTNWMMTYEDRRINRYYVLTEDELEVKQWVDTVDDDDPDDDDKSDSEEEDYEGSETHPDQEEFYDTKDEFNEELYSNEWVFHDSGEIVTRRHRLTPKEAVDDIVQATNQVDNQENAMSTDKVEQEKQVDIQEKGIAVTESQTYSYQDKLHSVNDAIDVLIADPRFKLIPLDTLSKTLEPIERDLYESFENGISVGNVKTYMAVKMNMSTVSEEEKIKWPIGKFEAHTNDIPKLKFEVGKHKVPKLIWSYWHSEEMTELLYSFVNTWHEFNKDYRIIVVTDKTLKNSLNKAKFEQLKVQTHQFRSDWIRLKFLKQYGGVWIDLSSIMRDSLDNLVTACANSDAGTFQISLCDRTNKYKTFESWLIICSEDNQLISEWFNITDNMMDHSEPNGDGSLEWLANNFPDLYPDCAMCVVPNLRKYLRIYITEMIAIKLTGDKEPSCICNDEGQLTHWHNLKYTDWFNIWRFYGGESKAKHPITIPIVKMIGKVRELVVHDYYSGKPLDKDSYISMALNCNRVPYDIYNRGKLEIKQWPEKSTSQPPKTTKYNGTKIILICTGTNGDFLQFKSLYDYLEAFKINAVLITHKDLLVNQPFKSHGLSVTSSQLMNLAIELQHKGEIGKAIRGIGALTTLANETATILKEYKDDNVNIIYNSPTVNVSKLKTYIGAHWLEINTFPNKWMTKVNNDTPNIFRSLIEIATAVGHKMITDNVVTEGNNKPIESQLLTCYDWMLPPGHGAATFGPLTINSYKSAEEIISLKRETIIVNFGSCKVGINQEKLMILIKAIMEFGMNCILIDDGSMVMPGTKLYDYINERHGKIEVIRKFNLYKFKNVIAMICHGGYGTIIDCLHNKVVPIVHPFIADQYEWCEYLESQNMGIHLKSLDSEGEILHQFLKLEVCKGRTLKHQRYLDVNLSKFSNWLRQTGNIPKLDNMLLSSTLVTLPADLIANDIPEELAEIKGCYNLNNCIYTIAYDPTTPTYCVRESIKAQLTSEGIENFMLNRSLPSMELMKEGVTKQSVIDGIISMGVNLIFINGKEGQMYNIFNNKFITLIADTDGMLWHCKYGKLQSADISDNLVKLATTVDLLDENLKHIVETTMSNYSAIEITTPSMLMKSTSKAALQDFESRMRSYNWAHLSSRSEIHIISLELIKYKYCFVGYHKCTDKSLSAGLVITQYGFKPVNWMVANQNVVIFADGDLPARSILINMHMQYPDPKSKLRLVTNSIPEICALNKSTVKWCITNNLYPRSNKLVTNLTKPFEVIIADYDNRSHHMYDERLIIESAKRVTIHSDRPVTVQELMESYNKPMDRLIIRNGQALYETSFDDKVRGQCVDTVFKQTIKSATPLCKRTMLTPDEVDYITKYFNIRENSLSAKDKLEFVEGSVLNKISLMNSLRTTNITEEEIDDIDNRLNDDGNFMINYLYKYNDIPMSPNVIWKQTGHIFIHSLGVCILPEKKAGGEDRVDRLWWSTDHGKITSGDWWGIQYIKSQRKASNEFLDTIQINNLRIHDDDDLPEFSTLDAVDEGELGLYIAPYTVNYIGSKIEPLYDMPDLISMQLWEDRDLTNWLNMYAPKNSCKIKSRELPGRIIENEKITMTRFPIKSRPVLSKVCFEEGRSITGRMKSVVYIRTITPEPLHTAIKVANTYFRTGWQSMIKKFMDEPIIIEPEDVKEWVEENKDTVKITKELLELLAGELITKPMSDVNVHLKVESLLKTEPITSMREQQARIIVWQRKAVCALYSKAFVKIKDRLKSVLHDKIIYADGLRPDELSAKIRLVKNVKGFFENDLTKQDRQTDKPIINVEMILYGMLGGHKNLISSWRENHETWRFKSKHYWGQGESMRLTGQATTALGNCITNMQVHQEFVKTNFKSLELALFLGDDMCMVFNEKPIIKNLRENIACKFNMQSKDQWLSNGATFCSMVLSKLPNETAELAADVVRLKFRYEVTNGVHEANNTNLLMRKASYLMMLGDIPGVKETVKNLGLPIKPISWYNYHLMLQSVSEKWNMTTQQVEGYYHNLLNMINQDVTYKYNFRLFGNN
ncbi:hypothetical protein [Hubei endorna-like virus 1]|uniref:hypothetical protein n=1 Tax=Hubei endorna-like virus 1 TaxID=1922893 RepID=UPI00090C105F|nr:hypothetical protein [Hubei endorna-like virus 1]APG77655.1 hypothetical protein [Hubei endorna-like virus 1]